MVKKPPANVGYMGWISGFRRPIGGRKWHPTIPVFFPGTSHEQRNLVNYGVAKSQLWQHKGLCIKTLFVVCQRHFIKRSLPQIPLLLWYLINHMAKVTFCLHFHWVPLKIYRHSWHLIKWHVNYKYICTQHRSTAICKANTNEYERGN